MVIEMMFRAAVIMGAVMARFRPAGQGAIQKAVSTTFLSLFGRARRVWADEMASLSGLSGELR